MIVSWLYSFCLTMRSVWWQILNMHSSSPTMRQLIFWWVCWGCGGCASILPYSIWKTFGLGRLTTVDLECRFSFWFQCNFLEDTFSDSSAIKWLSPTQQKKWSPLHHRSRRIVFWFSYSLLTSSHNVGATSNKERGKRTSKTLACRLQLEIWEDMFRIREKEITREPLIKSYGSAKKLEWRFVIPAFWQTKASFFTNIGKCGQVGDKS